jgi:hypothetical protein
MTSAGNLSYNGILCTKHTQFIIHDKVAPTAMYDLNRRSASGKLTVFGMEFHVKRKKKKK